MATIVLIGRETGYIFEGYFSGSYAFVPEGAVTFDDKGAVALDHIAYTQSRWDVRNMRFNNLEEGGSRLFPSVKNTLADLNSAPAKAFLTRLQAAYSVETEA